MARYIEGFRTDPKQNLYLDGVTRAGAGSIMFLDAQTGADPVSAAGTRAVFVDNSNRLSYWNGTSAVRLTGTGGVATTWEDLYGVDNIFALTTGTWTITQGGAFALLTLNKTNVGAGAVIAITNSGTGNDITGNGGNWLVTAAGAATVASLVSNGAITCTAISDVTAGATLQVNGNAAGGVDIGSTSTGGITLGRATTITTGGLVVSDTGITVSDGITDLIDNSNILSGLRLTNNTVTTFGAGGADTGVALLRSTSLTTGSLLSLQLTEGTLAGGFYIRCFDVTAGANVFTVGEDGAVVITGVAANVLTLTLGDVLLSDGSITVTDADNAATLSITNDTATTASVFVFAGSGVFTGATTTSFATLTASGLTTGTVLFTPAAALTTGTIWNATANAMTTGTLANITSTSAVLTSGRFLDFTWNPATYTGAGITTAGLVRFNEAPTISTTVAGSHNTLRIIRTNTTAAAAITYTVSGAIAYFENAAPTVGAGSTLTDSAPVVSILQSNTAASTGVALAITQSAGAGGTNAVTITGNSMTTSTGVLTLTANGITTGSVALLTSSGVMTGTGRLLELVASGATTAAAVCDLTTAALTTGGAFRITANALTTGVMLSLVHTTTVIAAGGSLARLSSTSIDTSTTTGCLLDLSSTASTAGTQVLATLSGLTTGIGISVVANALTTGSLLNISHTTTVIAAGGSLARLSSTSIDTSTTTGCLLDLVGSGSTVGTQVLGTFAALTTGTAVRIVANALTTGVLLDLETSDAGMAGSYIRCFDGAANDFTVGEDGRVVVTGTAGITAIAVTAGDITTADGAIASAIESVTLGAAATALAIDSNYIKVTGDGGGNSVATITGGVAGQMVVLEFQDGNVTIVNDNTHAANTIDLVGANTTFADDATLTLVFDGTSWYEIARSVNA